MRLLRCGRVKLEDNFGNKTLSDYATALVTGTKEELTTLEEYAVGAGFDAPMEEMEIHHFQGGRVTPILSIFYDIQAYRVADFKELYKKVKEVV